MRVVLLSRANSDVEPEIAIIEIIMSSSTTIQTTLSPLILPNTFHHFPVPTVVSCSILCLY